MRRHRTISNLGAIGAAVVTCAALPSVAAADHYATGSNDFCYAGGITTGIGMDIYTTDARLKIHKSGSADLTCRFDVPAYVAAEDSIFYSEWFRPKKATISIWCQLDQPSGPPVENGGTLQILPNGTGLLRCTLPPPPPPE